LAAACALLIQVRAQETTKHASITKSAVMTRECSANPVLASNAKKPPKSRTARPSEPAPSCLEVKGETIEVQEFLQALGREQQWRIGENHASEGAWSYLRYFDASELNSYAHTSDVKDSVKLTSGRAAVNVRTSEPKGAASAGNSLGSGWEARRRLGLGRADKERTFGIFQPQTATQANISDPRRASESRQSETNSEVRPLQLAAHLPNPSG
jgi:hypothetical protein